MPRVEVQILSSDKAFVVIDGEFEGGAIQPIGMAAEAAQAPDVDVGKDAVIDIGTPGTHLNAGKCLPQKEKDDVLKP
ncbi:hypothetical protein [Lentzea flava]|uniref:hypothetical protein n=1 Tax=Lentzea flava TaxID=103732 RepID=UPI00167085E7|nr:hypothetical protein [Lentzea flava]MCP2200069.1 hypothetical protein [Lentzea flava]